MDTTDIVHNLKKYKIPRKKHRVKFIVTLSLVKIFFLIFYLFIFGCIGSLLQSTGFSL